MKKGCENFPRVTQTNILIYNDKDIVYYDGVTTYMEQSARVDNGRYFLDGSSYNYIMGYDVTFSVPNLEKKESIKLDETTMRRIAKYNKEADILKLEEEIKKKKEQIKELDAIISDKSKRVDKLKKFVANLYDIDIDDEDDYDYYDD